MHKKNLYNFMNFYEFHLILKSRINSISIQDACYNQYAGHKPRRYASKMTIMDITWVSERVKCPYSQQRINWQMNIRPIYRFL